MVPKEPTPEMLAAAWNAVSPGRACQDDRDAYVAMIAAAPSLALPDSNSKLPNALKSHPMVPVGSDLQAATAKIVRESASLLLDAHKHSTQGVWRKGMSTHHTVCDLPNSRDYRIAEFHHADDANFCDHAHRLVPMLCQWVIAADAAACEAVAGARPTNGLNPNPAVPLADAIEVLRDLRDCGAVNNWLRVSDDLKARVNSLLAQGVGNLSQSSDSESRRVLERVLEALSLAREYVQATAYRKDADNFIRQEAARRVVLIDAAIADLSKP
jgi:hypothetical protein